MAHSDHYSKQILETERMVGNLAKNFGINERSIRYKELIASVKGKLFRHNFQDVNEPKVLRSIKNIGEKLLLAGRPQTSNRLMKLVSTLVAKDATIQTSDLEAQSESALVLPAKPLFGDHGRGYTAYSILLLLLELADRPSLQLLPFELDLQLVHKPILRRTEESEDFEFSPGSGYSSGIESWKEHFDSDSEDMSDWDEDGELIDYQTAPCKSPVVPCVKTIEIADQSTSSLKDASRPVVIFEEREKMEKPKQAELVFGVESTSRRANAISLETTMHEHSKTDSLEKLRSFSNFLRRGSSVESITSDDFAAKHWGPSVTTAHSLPGMKAIELCARYGDSVYKKTGLLLRGHMLSEAEIIRAVLHMFQGCSSSIFCYELEESCSNGKMLLAEQQNAAVSSPWSKLPKYTVSPENPICVSHLSPAALESHLRRLLDIGNATNYIRLFIEEVNSFEESEDSTQNASSKRFGSVMKAFTSAVDSLLVEFEQKITMVEYGLYDSQKGAPNASDNICTLIALENGLEVWFQCINFAMEFIERCMGWWWKDCRTERLLERTGNRGTLMHIKKPLKSTIVLGPLRERTEALLSALYESFVELDLFYVHNDDVEQRENITNITPHSWLMGAFHQSLAPYIAMINTWISQGSLSDPFEELFFSDQRESSVSSFPRKPQVSDTIVAYTGFQVHQSAVPVFLKDHFLGSLDLPQRIVLAGYDVSLMKNILPKDKKGVMLAGTRQFSVALEHSFSLTAPAVSRVPESSSLWADSVQNGGEQIEISRSPPPLVEDANFSSNQGSAFLHGTAEFLFQPQKYLGYKTHPALNLLDTGYFQSLNAKADTEFISVFGNEEDSFRSNISERPICFSASNIFEETKAPASIALERSFLQPVSKYCFTASAMCVSVFWNELQIFRFLTAVRAVFLDGHSTLLEHFELSLFALLQSIGSKGRSFLIENEKTYFSVHEPESYLKSSSLLTSLLQSSLQAILMELPDFDDGEIPPKLDFLKIFMVDLPGTEQNLGNLMKIDIQGIQDTFEPISYLGALEVGLCCPWPYDVFLSSTTLERCNKIFCFILQLKYTKQVMEFTHRKQRHIYDHPAFDKDILGDADHRHELMVWLSRILHVVRTFHDYVMTQACNPESWQAFQDKLYAANSLCEMVGMHKSFAFTVAERCFLLPRSKTILNYILGILHCGINFVSVYEQYLVDLDCYSEALLLAERNKTLIQTSPSQTTAGTEKRNPVAIEDGKIKAKCESAYAEIKHIQSHFHSNISFVHVIIEQMVSTRLAPYLDEILVTLNFNAFFTQFSKR